MKKRILIVDDNQQNRDILMEAFEDDYELEQAFDGKEALIKYHEFAPDLIFLDVMMPNMDGKEALRIIRDTETAIGRYIGKGAVPIVMLTAHKEPWLEAFKNGCDFYVLKPFEAAKLRSLAKEILNGQK